MGTFVHLQTSALGSYLYYFFRRTYLVIGYNLILTIPVEGPVLQGRAYKTTNQRFIHGPKVSGPLVTGVSRSTILTDTILLNTAKCSFQTWNFMHLMYN